eukprot:CAMPEP_0172895036 /NCGR_PEP_ID=MMETSP1075-20121228/152199_1 /TAXON_ID=2916 /ORGANISM="Ceratium fusus, Strain PA161109" /LENGTH=218 /DNA_ID=CAMNT_0013750175 /DNA_START=36 /DNA_END=694 /DNA_ORIENTATION=+
MSQQKRLTQCCTLSLELLVVTPFQARCVLPAVGTLKNSSETKGLCASSTLLANPVTRGDSNVTRSIDALPRADCALNPDRPHVCRVGVCISHRRAQSLSRDPNRRKMHLATHIEDLVENCLRFFFGGPPSPEASASASCPPGCIIPAFSSTFLSAVALSAWGATIGVKFDLLIGCSERWKADMGTSQKTTTMRAVEKYMANDAAGAGLCSSEPSTGSS